MIDTEEKPYDPLIAVPIQQQSAKKRAAEIDSDEMKHKKDKAQRPSYGKRTVNPDDRK